MEDGFIRSVGLGSNLYPPLSVAVDSRGIYYDPTRPSDLEHILQTTVFDERLLNRARALQQHLIAAGISKYGTGESTFPARRAGSRLILVPGQVEDDESVRLGGGGVAGNLDLLRRTRTHEPDAEIWFRPHPDVDAGHRKGRIADVEALRFADRVLRGGSMARLLDLVDGLHVLSSLAGFEGLIRGREVTVHGVPFYAGWGLTRDLAPAPARRTRRLQLPELIAATLILYPRYLDPVTRLPCPVETLVARLEAQGRPAPNWLSRLRELQGKLIGKKTGF
jgi:capsular polysaccharide export protein